MRCQQSKLICGNRHQVSWIDESVKSGDSIRFRGDERWWLVEQTYKPILDKGEIKHDWKAGGNVRETQGKGI